MVHYELPQFMHVAKGAIKELFNDPKDVFWTGKAMDLFYHGIEIDCNTEDPLAKIACREIKKRKDTSFVALENNKFLFSFFGGVRYSSKVSYFQSNSN